jgi:hypothetical protein
VSLLTAGFIKTGDKMATRAILAHQNILLFTYICLDFFPPPRPLVLSPLLESFRGLFIFIFSISTMHARCLWQ